MVSKKLTTYLMVVIMSVLALSATSCQADYYYNDPIVGSWILAYDEYGYVDYDYAEIYFFDNDGYGYLDWYDQWGRHYVDDFTWTSRGDYIEIYYYNGTAEAYYYYFRNGELILWDGYDPHQYRGYRRY